MEMRGEDTRLLAGLHVHAEPGKTWIWSRVVITTTMRSNTAGSIPVSSSALREVISTSRLHSALALSDEVAFVGSGAPAERIGGVDNRLDILVGQDPFRQETANPGNAYIEAHAVVLCSSASSCRATCRAIRSGMLQWISFSAMWIAFSNAKRSAPP